MPTKPPHECNMPGCRRLTHRRFCDECARRHWRTIDAGRGSSADRGYDQAWQRLTRVLAGDPVYALCAHCKARGIIRAREVFDHIVPISAGGERLDPANIQPLCKPCHSRKTVIEDRCFERSRNHANGN